MNRFLITMLLMVVAVILGGCWSRGESPGTEYFQRIDTITAGAGNAKDANAAIHVIDPWPPRAGDQRIPGQGERMVNAIDRYKGRGTTGGGQQQPGAPSASPASIGTLSPNSNGNSNSGQPF